MYITAPPGTKVLARNLLPADEYQKLEVEDFNVYGDEKSLEIMQFMKDLGWVTINFEEFDKISVKPTNLGLEIFESGISDQYIEKNGWFLDLIRSYLKDRSSSGNPPISQIEQLAEHFLKVGNHTRVVDFSSMLITIGSKAQDYRISGIGHYYYGSVNLYKMELEFVRAHFEKAILNSEKVNDTRNVARSYLGLASYYGYKGNVDEAMRIFEKCYLLYREINDNSGLNQVRMNEAYAYALKGDFQNFFKLNHEAISYYESCEDFNHLQYCYQNEASTLINIGNHDLAIEASSEAYSLSTKTGNKRVQHLSGLGIATIYILTKRPGDAYNYINEAFEYFRQNLDTNGMANSYMTYMCYYIATRNFQDADTNLRKAEQYFLSKKSNNFVVGSYFRYLQTMKLYGYSESEYNSKLRLFKSKASTINSEKVFEDYLKEMD